MMREALIAAMLAVLATAAAHAEPIALTSHVIPLYPERPEDNRVGRLSYRSGLEISSAHRQFGGLSDLVVSEDGTRLLAVTDQAHWFRAELSYNAVGMLSGIANGELVPMKGLAGSDMLDKDGDAESMTTLVPQALDGAVLVGFERNHRVWHYDLSRGLDVLPEPVAMGDWILGLGYNEGLEGIALLGDGRLLALSENGSAANGDILGSLESEIDGTQPISIVRRPPYLVTGVAAGPDGGVFLLERRFSILGGVGMEIRFIPDAEIQPGARLNGEVLADLGFQEANIDNMEGIAARRGDDGGTLLYVLSDDNFQRPLQRTLLLMFEFRP
jgi:hypothetical protein